jgi:predicted GNAT family N-acyltransferase
MNSVHYQIKQPQTEDEFKHYYHLRWKILRAPWNEPEGSETDDIEDQCYHLMAVTSNNAVIGVARLQFNTSNEAQIRYMAIAEGHSNKGIGAKLVTAMEQQAIKKQCQQMVLHAREPAIEFYKKSGYQVVNKSHLLFGEIQHYYMKKNLLRQ